MVYLVLSKTLQNGPDILERFRLFLSKTLSMYVLKVLVTT